MNKEQATRLAKAISEIKPIVKDKKNPHFKNNYADINTMLDDVKPALHANGLFLLQPVNELGVTTQICDTETGEIITSASLPLNLTLNAQGIGSQITYFRRYTLQSLLGLEAEDDDGNAGSAPQPKAQPKPAAPVKKAVETEEQFTAIVEWVQSGRATLDKAKQLYNFTAAQLDELETILYQK